MPSTLAQTATILAVGRKPSGESRAFSALDRAACAATATKVDGIGRYTATLPKAAGALAETHTKSLHIWPGDSDGDGSVGFGDFGDLATNFNAVGGPVYRPGDMDGNGNVNFSDFGILATNFNRVLPALTLDFGDALESGTSFQTTLANDGARHVLGSGLFLGATVDAEVDGQPDANAAGDGADEDGVTFATLTAGTNAGVTVTANVPGSAVLNAWIDFNADGDWDDTGEQVFVDQSLTSGANNLTATVPSGATAGATLARFRVSGTAGYSYFGLAVDGEVEDYQVTIVAAKGSSSRVHLATSFNLWAGAFVAEPARPQTASVGPQRQAGESVWNSVQPAASQVVDLAVAEVASTDLRPQASIVDSSWLDEDLVDRVFEEKTDLLLLDNGSGGAI